jgi:hypothetical protein
MRFSEHFPKPIEETKTQEKPEGDPFWAKIEQRDRSICKIIELTLVNVLKKKDPKKIFYILNHTLMTDPNTIPLIRIDTRPKLEPIPDTDTNGIDGGEG